MIDAEYRKQKKRVGDFLTKWQGPMGLRQVKIEVIWDRSYNSDSMVAETNMGRWEYREYDITFYLPSCAEQSDEDLERVVVHELAHCLLAPISMSMLGTDENDKYRRKIMEFNTELVTSALFWVRSAGEDDQIALAKKLAKDVKMSGIKHKEKSNGTNSGITEAELHLEHDEPSSDRRSNSKDRRPAGQSAGARQVVHRQQRGNAGSDRRHAGARRLYDEGSWKHCPDRNGG